jgi:hypothetical protein
MVRIPVCLISFLLAFSAWGQVSFSSGDALYPTLEDLILHHPDTNCHLRKIDDVRVDSLVKRCWFTDRDKGMIKDVIAVAWQSQLFFQDQEVRQKLPCTFHPHARKESNCFYPVLERGRYYYFEMLSEDKNPDLAIAMAMMGGAVGSAVGNTLTPPELVRSYILFDTSTQSFFGLDTWKDFAFFLQDHFSKYPVSHDSGQPNREEVRHLVSLLNRE